jgi:hypothetical protein
MLRPWRSLLFVFATILAAALAPARPALAKTSTRLVVSKLSLPKDHDSNQFERAVRKRLVATARKLDFGSAKKVEITAKITQYTIETSDDLVRVTCTLVGRLKGGGTARSHISFGDRPSRRKKLEAQVLKIATESVLIRLADMTRAAEALEKKKKKKEQEQEQEQAGTKPANVSALGAPAGETACYGGPGGRSWISPGSCRSSSAKKTPRDTWLARSWTPPTRRARQPLASGPASSSSSTARWSATWSTRSARSSRSS